ncbi:hypothetical protein ACIQBJ_21885 [Kitasatospora sp. NPDC088391]|uniref:hypothetical protein n=1 Tax=Kitasatospora sp. NPDC088391 TaxID=3364074 RepID=UPI00381D65D2
MDLRTKKTLSVLLRGAIILAGWTLFGLARGKRLGVSTGFLIFLAVYAALAGYTWWWYGDSPGAVARREKAEYRKARRKDWA